LYSFGVTAYHLLAGFPPFKGSTAFEVAAKHVQQDPEPLSTFRPDLPADLLALVHRLMAKSPAERYQSAKDVIRDLHRIQKGLAVEGGPPPVPLSLSSSSVRPTPAVPRSPSRWPGRVAAVLLVLFLAAVGWWLAGVTEPGGEPSAPPPAVGLAEVRLPTPLVSSRETALREQAEKAVPHSREHLTAVFDLGLLLTAERRWDEAEKLFKGLEVGPKANRPDGLPVSAAVLGKLGQAIVFAHQDKPKESIEAFAAAVNTIQPKGQMKQAMERLCFDHPAIGQAIAEAVNRDLDNPVAGVEVPASVRWLRTPSSVLSGPK
jgi:serine/threonine-protein kinase